MIRHKPNPRVLLLAILALCAGGAWISGELVKQHADRSGAAATSGIVGRLCSAVESTGVGCAGALQSGWAVIRIPLPRPGSDWSLLRRPVKVPVAFLGLAYFVFIGTWFGFLGRPRQFGGRWQRIPLHVTLVGAAASAFYFGLMAFGFAPWCVACLVVHAINAALVGVVWWLVPRWTGVGADTRVDLSQIAPARIARLTLTTREALGALAVAVILIGGMWGYRREKLIYRADFERLQPYHALVTSLRKDPEFLLREFSTQPSLDMPAPGESAAASDRLELVIFTDFECPGCYCNAQWLRGGARELFGDAVDVRVRHFPLAGECNDFVAGDGHANACGAAYAAEAARLQGGDDAFTLMHDLLFENQDALGLELYRDLAGRIGLDPDRLARDMESEHVRDAVEADVALARRLGVSGTPTMILDGRLVPELCRTPVFWRTVAGAPWMPGGDVLADRARTAPAAPNDSIVPSDAIVEVTP